VGELVIRPVFALTLSDLCFLLAFAAVVVQGVIRRVPFEFRLPWLLLVGALLFNAGGAISSLYSNHSRASLLELARLDYLLVVWLWLGPQIITRTDQLFFAVRLWTISSALAGAGAVIQLVFGDVIPNTHISSGRMTGLTQQVNDLGGLTAIALVPCLMLATMPDMTRVQRLLGIGAAVLVLAGLILSGSVTGFVAAGLSVGAWLITTSRDRRLLLTLGALVAAILGVVVVQAVRKGVSPEARLVQVFTGPGDQSTGRTRLQVDLTALQAIQHHPFVGVGLDSASYIKVTGDLVHNILIEAWLGAGLLGFVGLGLILVAVARAVVHRIRECGGEQRLLAQALLSSFVAFFVFSMAAPVLLSRYAWLPAAMILILHRLCTNQSGRDAVRTSAAVARPTARIPAEPPEPERHTPSAPTASDQRPGPTASSIALRTPRTATS
jgi:O-antigen ligase